MPKNHRCPKCSFNANPFKSNSEFRKEVKPTAAPHSQLEGKIIAIYYGDIDKWVPTLCSESTSDPISSVEGYNSLFRAFDDG